MCGQVHASLPGSAAVRERIYARLYVHNYVSQAACATVCAQQAVPQCHCCD